MLDHYQKFYLKDVPDLQAELERLNLTLPISLELDVLSQPVEIDGHRIPNRLWIQPMQGWDAEPSGAPGPLTRRRYRRYVEGGFGLIWIEATAVAPAYREGPGQLCLQDGNRAAFTEWIEELRQGARNHGAGEVVLILQLSMSTREEGLTKHASDWQRRYLQAATWASEAGFDGIDLRCCYGDPIYDGLTEPEDGGAAGSRFLIETFQLLRSAHPELILSSRLTLYDAVPHPNGFGVNEQDYRNPDPGEPIRLLHGLHEAGLSLLNLSTLSPNLKESGRDPILDTDLPQEHPLTGMHRNVEILRQITAAIPGLHTVGGGLSWLRHLLPEVGAGMVQEGLLTAVGFARSALAHPGAATQILTRGYMDRSQCCMRCQLCSEQQILQAPTGCVIRDSEVYGREYRHQRRYDPNHIMEEIRRCHDCEAAPCVAAAASGMDIPSFLRLYRNGRNEKAYDVVRHRNVFPEMTAHLTPSWMEAEAACIETVLTGQPVPIRDAQLTLARWARTSMDIGVRLPAERSGKPVAVVGGGPAGLAATHRLLEQGHQVVLFEREERLGGIPEWVIPKSRFPGAEEEIAAVLKPALDQGRLTLHLNHSLGKEVQLNELLQQYAVVLLALGVWQERSLGGGPGVIPGLSLLRQVKSGERTRLPSRVAILSGGDSAMDVARVAQQLGARDIFIIYEGTRADMHWHMEETWFASKGVHCLILNRPMGYTYDEEDQQVHLRIARMEPGSRDEAGSVHLQAVPDGESILKVDAVIEAMGLSVEAPLASLLREAGMVPQPGTYRTDSHQVFVCGAMCNGGASVERCVAEGLDVADQITAFLQKGK